MPKGKTLTDAEKAKRNEERAAKFKELGTKRVNNAVNAINRLIALSNKNQYVYTTDQVEVIINALETATGRVKTAFSGGKADAGGIEL